MVNILTPSGVEQPDAGELHSRDMFNRNMDKVNQLWINAMKNNDPFGHCGATGGFQTIGGSNVAVTFAAAQRLAGGMTFETASAGRLVIPKSGQYLIMTRIYATGGSAYGVRGGAYVNGTSIAGSDVKFWKGDGADYFEGMVSRFYFNAGDKIGLGMDTPASMSTWGTDGYNGSWLELFFMTTAT